MGSGAKGRFSAGRERFRRWRHRRPFWGGLLTLLSGLVLFGSTQLTLGSMQVRVGVEGMQSIVIPIVLVVAGLLIWFMPDHRVFYGIITLVVAVYSLIGVNLGGFVIGLLLGVAGGALAIAWAPRPGDVATGAETSEAEAPDGSSADDDADDDTVSVDDMLGEDPGDTVDDGTLEPDAGDEPGSPDEGQPKHRAHSRTLQRRERPSIRSAVAAGAGCAALAIVAFVAPGLAGQAGAVAPNLPIPTLPPLLPTSEPEPTESPEPPDKPNPTVTIDPTAEPSESPEPTAEPEPSESPEPTESPESSEPEDTPDPESPSPEPTPTESPVIEVPEGETPSEPRDLETPDQVVAEEPGRLTGSSITMVGLSYDGVVDVQTDSGTKRMMQFSMDSSVTDDFSLLVPDEKGDLLTLANQLTVEGDVKFYSDRFSGTLLGVPLTFTPDFPPPLTLPVMTFGQPDINLALVTSDSLTADEMRQFFPDEEE